MRFLFYSPDSYGLGHIRRTISVCERLLSVRADASALVLTGAPRAHLFAYPVRCDYMKLPSISKREDGQYMSRDIDLSLAETVNLRSRVIAESAASFRPDVIVVDHNPIGLCGEALRMLEEQGRAPSRPVRVVGLRDVIDEPESVRRAWTADGAYDALRRHYDLALVYGQKDVFDAVAEYRIPDDVARKVVFTGYLHRNHARTAPDEIRRRLAPRTGRLVVVTVGGGGDGNLIVRSFLEGYAALGADAPFEAFVVTGPLMSPKKRARIFASAGSIPGVGVVEHADDMPALFRAADLVVAMAGYNSVCELACAGARALLVPRVFPRREQIVRTERLAARGVVRFLEPDQATPEALMRAVRDGLDGPRPPRRWGLEFSGLDRTAAAILGRRAPVTAFFASQHRIEGTLR